MQNLVNRVSGNRVIESEMNTKTTNKKHTIACGAGIIFLMATSANSWADTGIDDVKTSLQPDDFNIVQHGKNIYQAQCAACHGVELQGQPNWEKPDASGRLPAPPHDKTGHTWHHSDDLLFEITKYGPAAAAEMPKYQSNMPAYENILSDDDIIAVLSYIKSSWPQQEREWQDALNGNSGESTGIGGVSKGLLAQLTGKTDGEHTSAGNKHMPTLSAETIKPTKVANDFAAALSSGDMEQIKRLVADEAIIFEEGSAEQSFAEYERDHLPQDIRFMRRVERIVKDQQEIHQGSLAIVLTQTDLKGKPASSKIHLAMLETMILKKSSTGWKIVHIHWSSRIL